MMSRSMDTMRYFVAKYAKGYETEMDSRTTEKKPMVSTEVVEVHEAAQTAWARKKKTGTDPVSLDASMSFRHGSS